MNPLTPLPSGRGLPDLSVVEFAIMIALVRFGPQHPPSLLPTLSEWFGRAISLGHIRPALRRLEHQGYLTTLEGGSLSMRRASAEPVALSLTALIRIVGSEFGRVLKRADPPLLAYIMKKSAGDEAVAAEEKLRKRQGKPGLTDAQRGDIREHARKEARDAQVQPAKPQLQAGQAKRAKRKKKGLEALDNSSKE